MTVKKILKPRDEIKALSLSQRPKSLVIHYRNEDGSFGHERQAFGLPGPAFFETLAYLEDAVAVGLSVYQNGRTVHVMRGGLA